MENLALCFGLSNSKKRPTLTIEELCRRFTFEEIQKSTNNFDQRRIIGRGSFGAIYKGSSNGGTDYTVAIKRRSIHSRQDDSVFKNEIQLLCQLRHPNLISLVGFCDDKNEMIIVYEYMPNRSLADNLHHNHHKLSWKRRLEICIGAARGLHYLHTGAKHTIFHRGVQPSHILLDKNWVPKLSKFGFSIKGPFSLSKAKKIEVDKIVGTYGFIAPEYARTGNVTDKVDVYTFGMVMLELVCKSIHDISITKMDMDESDYFKNLASLVCDLLHKGRANEILDPILIGKIAPECWNLFMEIAQRCLLEETTERPTMGEVEVELERVLELQEEADAMNKGI